jgi:hypothetical protein
MRITTVYALLMLAAGSPVPQTGAQGEPPRRGQFLRLGAGLGNATNTITGGNGTNDATGFLGSVHAGFGGQRLQAVLALDWQPFRVQSAIADEAVRLWYLLGGVQFFLNRQIYLRPSVGLARGNWSGPAAAVSDEGYVAAGIALGAEWRAWRRQWLATELGVRGATCFGDCSFETRLLSLEVMFPFY